MAPPMQHDGSRARNGSSEDDGGYDTHNMRKPGDRYAPDQIQRLEGFYKECPYPNKKELELLGTELSLKPRQIKAQNDCVDNHNLQKENNHLQREKIAMEETPRNIKCGSYGNTTVIGEESKEEYEKLKQKNNELQHEVERLSAIVAMNITTPLSKPTYRRPDTDTSSLANASLAFESDSLTENIFPGNLVSTDQMTPHPWLKRPFLNVMIDTAPIAIDEMIKVLRFEQPVSIMSAKEGQTDLNRRIESSQYSGVVAMDARSLVDIYIDSDKRVELFPTLFSNAKTIYVARAGSSENNNDSLQLIHEQMHAFSPWMQQREFYLLRCCKQIESSTWVIVDVSYDCFGGVAHVSPTLCFKQPSGCMIEEMPNGLSRVTCLERVDVGNSVLGPPLYEDLLKNTMAFGAKRWVTILKRTCERYSFLKEAVKIDDNMGTGRSCMIMLANKMIKSYCSAFSSFTTSDFCQLSNLTSNWVQITGRVNTCPDQPVGVVLQAACSFWVPASHDRVACFLSDHSRRSEWDILCFGGQVSEVMKMRTGCQSPNAISIMQAGNCSEDIMIFQESMVDEMGSLIVFAPLNGSSMLELAHGLGSPSVQILPSGFAITPDARKERLPSTSSNVPQPSGSIITAAFQFLASTSLSKADVSPNLVSVVHDFVNHSVSAVKNSL